MIQARFAKRRADFLTAALHGEQKIMVSSLVRDLMWRPTEQLVRFVVVSIPARGRLPRGEGRRSKVTVVLLTPPFWFVIVMI